jgi:hypothetical protein
MNAANPALTSAVMPGTLPAEWLATHPTSPLSVCQRRNAG